MPADDFLAGFTGALDELRMEFGAVAADMANTLLDRKVLPKSDCDALYRQLDAQFGMPGRPPKSDIVCRVVAKHFQWDVPQDKVLLWDFKARN